MNAEDKRINIKKINMLFFKERSEKLPVMKV